MEVMHYVTFALLLNMSRAWLFLIQVLIIANVKAPFTPKSVMNKPQAEGKVNSRVKSRAQEKKV